MDKVKKPADDILRRPLYVYDLPHEVLNTLALKDLNQPPSGSEQLSAAETSEEPSRSSSTADLGSQSCSLCFLGFPTVQEQRSHQRSDLHNYNLKQKLRGRKAATEAEFETLIKDLDESLSGSESESEDDSEDDKGDSTLTALLKRQATLADRSRNGVTKGDGAIEEDGVAQRKRGSGKPPLLWFSSPVLPSNTYFGIYRAIFTSTEAQNENEITEHIKRKQLDPIPAPKLNANGDAQLSQSQPAASAGSKSPHIFLCMIGGGHFAAMVVSLAPRQTKGSSSSSSSGPLNREATVLAHKTFHRYTTRRKQGGSQSANDNAKGNAHSAGSSIRRYNEQALVDEVRQLLGEWRGLLDAAELLFVRATGSTNRRTLFGPYEGQVLRAGDPRLRGFPFSTRCATQNELMRSFIELTRLKVREIVELDEGAKAAPGDTAQKATAAAKSAKPPAAPKLSEEEETALLNTSQLQACIRRSKLPALLSYLKSNDVPVDFVFQPADAPQNHHAPTCLHLSASQNSAPLVSGLLLKAGADPTIRNREGKTAFELAGDRGTRDAFRVARDELGEGKWDWEAAKVPPALKREEAERREARERADGVKKEAERRKAEEARLRSEGPRVDEGGGGGGGKAKGSRSVLSGAGAQKSAQEKREEEARGLTPEQRIKLDRERRARAAEERLRRMQAGGG